MPNSAISRISITLPPEVLAIADQLARALDRPRSWVFAEAVRRFDTTAVPSADGLARLEADLLLGAEDRVRAAEAAAGLASEPPRLPTDQILAFNRFEEYLQWDERSRGRR